MIPKTDSVFETESVSGGDINVGCQIDDPPEGVARGQVVIGEEGMRRP